MNYEQMTDKELRAEVAKREGRTFLIDDYFTEDDWMTQTKDGHVLVCPNWPQDANDALELLSDMDVITIDQRNIDVWIYRFPGDEIHVDASTIDYPLTPQTIARLWSIAWLRWKDSE